MRTSTSRSPIGRVAPLLVAPLLAACITVRNYRQPEGPVYRGGAVSGRAPAGVDTLRVVTFNVEFGVRVDSAIAALTLEPELRAADIVLLQEMDAAGTARIAGALGMAYAYYPATLRNASHRDFGNAVLSRWPLSEASKLILPHPQRFNHSLRIATAVTVRVGERVLRVYSVHLATSVGLGPGARRDQLRAVVQDAEGWPLVIIGGDMNSGGVGRVAEQAGFAWPTRGEARTAAVGHLDHIFLKGLAPPDSAAAGTADKHHASDHRPVWVRAIVR